MLNYSLVAADALALTPFLLALLSASSTYLELGVRLSVSAEGDGGEYFNLWTRLEAPGHRGKVESGVDPGYRPLERSFVRRIVLVLGIILGSVCALLAQTPRMLMETLPTDASPIQLGADYVATQGRAANRSFVGGNVVVSQGASTVLADDAVVRV